MPFVYLFEMVADWIGASKTYGNSLEEWLPKNIGRFLLHEETRTELAELLRELGFDIIDVNGALAVNIWK